MTYLDSYELALEIDTDMEHPFVVLEDWTDSDGNHHIWIVNQNDESQGGPFQIDSREEWREFLHKWNAGEVA
jgi:predicted SpoU family rRNA methylase